MATLFENPAPTIAFFNFENPTSPPKYVEKYLGVQKVYWDNLF